MIRPFPSVLVKMVEFGPPIQRFWEGVLDFYGLKVDVDRLSCKADGIIGGLSMALAREDVTADQYLELSAWLSAFKDFLGSVSAPENEYNMEAFRRQARRRDAYFRGEPYW